MMHGKWGRSKLCPMSLGLALGLTSALAAFLMASWAIYQGVPPDMLAQHPDLVPMTWADAGWLTLWTFIKGLIFGFILALIYDLITCVNVLICSMTCIACARKSSETNFMVCGSNGI